MPVVGSIRRRRSKAAWVALGALVAAVPSTLLATQSAHADQTYTVTTLHFAVHVDPTGSTPCDVIGDLYLPDDASPSHKVPAILTTNGFGGSKDDQIGIGKAFAARDYAVLSYSGLGFGGTSCRITLDDPDYDGKAASQLISYLGGAPGIAYTDAGHTTAAPQLTSIVHDAVDHAGHLDTYDPRVGMIGGSYGGGIQFATAGDDPRLDTIVPIITWNDLSYSLDPNNSGQTATRLSSATPGQVKLTWGLLLSGDGLVSGLANAPVDPGRLVGCPDFAAFVCPALVEAGVQGYFSPGAVAAFQHASVASYMSRVKVPVLLMQGEGDTLFNLNEAAANYQALKAQGTTVKMIWQSWGHSQPTPAPGELDLNNLDPATQYETARVNDWFNHYLKNSPVSTGPAFAYFRNWVPYNGIATPAYATAAAFPLTAPKVSYYFSGSGQLVTSPLLAAAGSQSLVTMPAGAPADLTNFDAIGGQPQPDSNITGTYATWTGLALTSALNVVGTPTLTFSVVSPTAAATQVLGPAGELSLFAKIYDVAPDGSKSLINGLVAPFRVANVKVPIHLRLPGIVHQFALGHRVAIVISGGDLNYRGGLLANPVIIKSGAGQVLTLPTGT